MSTWTGSIKRHRFTTSFLSPKRTVPQSDAGSVDRQQTPSTDLRHPFSKEDGAGKRCWECGPAANSKHRFTTSFLQRRRCRKAMLGVWTGSKLQAPIYDILSPKRTVPESDAGSVGRQHCLEFLNWSTSFHPGGVCRCDRTRLVLRCVGVNRYDTLHCVRTLQDNFILQVFVFCHGPDITGRKTPTY